MFWLGVAHARDGILDDRGSVQHSGDQAFGQFARNQAVDGVADRSRDGLKPNLLRISNKCSASVVTWARKAVERNCFCRNLVQELQAGAKNNALHLHPAGRLGAQHSRFQIL